MGSSLWASCNAVWQLQSAKIKKVLDIEPSSKQQKVAGPSERSQLVVTSNPNPQSSSSTGLESAKSKSPGALPSTASTSTEQNLDKPWLLRPLPTVPQPNTDLSEASSTFRRSLRKKWQHAQIPPPRGSFLVSGLVEVHGPKAICTLDVRAAYDPGQSQWAAIGISMRRVQRRKQRPNGGAA